MDIDFTTLLIALAMDLATTVLFYLIVPIILAIRGKQMTLKKIKWICVINAVSIFILFIVIRAILGSSGTSAAALLWGYVGYAIMKKRLYTKFQKDEDETPLTHAKNGENDMNGSINNDPNLEYVVGSKTSSSSTKSKDDPDNIPFWNVHSPLLWLCICAVVAYTICIVSLIVEFA